MLGTAQDAKGPVLVRIFNGGWVRKLRRGVGRLCTVSLPADFVRREVQIYLVELSDLSAGGYLIERQCNSRTRYLHL